MEQALQIAIENGYEPKKTELNVSIGGTNYQYFVKMPTTMLLDPLFWSSLGKGLGWEHSCSKPEYCGRELEWKERWHEFIDMLCEGKDIDSFFADLLKN